MQRLLHVSKMQNFKERNERNNFFQNVFKKDELESIFFQKKKLIMMTVVSLKK
jgi:hypothetical protein